jgi:hypothetical protein
VIVPFTIVPLQTVKEFLQENGSRNAGLDWKMSEFLQEPFFASQRGNHQALLVYVSGCTHSVAETLIGYESGNDV